MTPEDMHAAERARQEARHKALMAVAGALTDVESRQVLRKVSDQWPRLNGATVADVLDITTQHDMFLELTEPFYERHENDLPDIPGPLYAVHTVILLGQPLAVGAVLSLLQRAGIITPEYPQARASVVLEDGAEANRLLVCARAAASLRATGAGEGTVTRFTAATRDRKYMPAWRTLARYVTLVTEFESAACAPYDPTHDLAVVLLEAWDSNPPTRTSPELAQAFANLQRSVGMASIEQAEAHLRQLLSRIDWRSHS